MELNTQTNEGEVQRVITVEVVGAISEDADILQSREVSFDTATDVPVTDSIGVGAETAANHKVRSDAEGLDRSAEDQISVELVMSGVGSIGTVAALNAEVFIEEVFSENAATECVVSTFFGDESTTEAAEAKARTKGVTGRSWRRVDHFAALARVGNGTGESAGSERD